MRRSQSAREPGRSRRPRDDPLAYGKPPAPDRDSYRDYPNPYAAPPRDSGRDRRYQDTADYGYDQGGYRSDGPSRQRSTRYDRDSRGYDGGYDQRRRDDGYRSAGGGRRSPQLPPEYYYPEQQRSRSGYDRDQRERHRDSGYDPRDRYYEDNRRRSYHDDRDSRQKKKSRLPFDLPKDFQKHLPKDWQKQAGELFVTYALPVIKKEGPKLFKEFLSKRGGRS